MFFFFFLKVSDFRDLIISIVYPTNEVCAHLRLYLLKVMSELISIWFYCSDT